MANVTYEIAKKVQKNTSEVTAMPNGKVSKDKIRRLENKKSLVADRECKLFGNANVTEINPLINTSARGEQIHQGPEHFEIELTMSAPLQGSNLEEGAIFDFEEARKLWGILDLDRP